MLGLSGEKEALVIKDVMSGLKNIYPVSSKNADDAVLSIRHFCGERPVTGFYSDNSGELKKACKIMKILHDGSQPGLPQSKDQSGHRLWHTLLPRRGLSSSLLLELRCFVLLLVREYGTEGGGCWCDSLV